MKTHFITYSDKNFETQRINLVNYANNTFDYSYGYNREWLVETDFYKENSELLDNKRGAGFWIWKPYIILNRLNSIDENDIIFYLDCADVFTIGLSDFLKDYFHNNNTDCLLSHGGSNKQKHYTKRDAFYLMGCDENRYHEHVQLEAGMLCFKNTNKIRKIIYEWLQYCTNPNIISDLPNLHGDNFEGFIVHQSDQSVISNLSLKYNLNTNNLLRNFVTCNVNQ
jgi:hypothetical protein